MPSDLFSPAPSQGPASRIRVGIGGWNFAPWRNNFYPAGLVQRRELEYASRHLRAIEINGTYYGAQKPATYAKWASETPDDFVFSLKAPRYITEGKRLADAGRGIDGFVFGGLAEFGNRLGPVLWQFTPSRAFDANDLAAFLDMLPRELNGQPMRHVLEVRHRSFLDERYVELARSYRIPTVFTDSPQYPSLADLTGDFAYARLMRSESHIETGYAPADLDAWSQRARAWAEGCDLPELPHMAAPRASGNPRDVFVYFISSAKERNPAAAMALQQRVDAEG
ncbi:Uncharacterized conserved protein YecE, DUF72 family [Dyella jiangningensis]|uniref:DUF72 domain-containing protein n=1 Tax=Dyella sp. AtDHG13 TaxID=1938897 RepID=UPI00087F8AB4|nr:DUF72 domain-containing protein [Dyella sp. AtDHG13]PXV61553.1 uncharacterized protein YecE (DUF72 family) [Dyella sp. AtDHG13]SDJ71680.1 Uncharacterized conserved protein YecE, DUF72 family [Dyella jiangningensis]